MKSKFFLHFWFFTLIALIPWVSCNARALKAEKIAVSHEKTNPDTSSDLSIVRESITFILGEDKNSDNPYYTQAMLYYRNNSAGKTTYLQTQCRSLKEVRDYLVKYAPANNQPWGRVNLVSHGDKWLGLSTKVVPGSKRSTVERLQEYLKKDTFPTLPDNIIDQQSHLVIHACGVGNNTTLIELIAQIFSTSKAVPKISAPRLFEYYATETTSNGDSINLQYMAQSWMVAYPNNENPGKIRLCNLLHEKYPKENMDWHDAITREHPRYGGDTYSYSFVVPVIIELHPAQTDTLPDFKIKEARLNWLKRQADVAKVLSKMEIPLESFCWSLKRGYSVTKGTKKLSVQVKGYCTIHCILKPLVEDKVGTKEKPCPINPSLDNSNYYYTLGGTSVLNDETASR